MDLKAPRGTNDILPGTVEKWHFVEDTFRKICFSYGYKEIRTPVFEHTELFSRGIGEGTDIVDKEMYTFLDRKGRSLTLRPEWTAPVMRSVIEHNLSTHPPLKLFYIGPIFRYERPQQGRYRQAHQLGVEVIGSDSPLIDVEMIELIIKFYTSLGLKDLSVGLNSIGCSECRPFLREKIIEFCKSNLDSLCGNCQSRFERNPFRILDCKNSGCVEFSKNCPPILDNLCGKCKEHFNMVTHYLDKGNIPYVIINNMVRGLDYYTKTVFEVISKSLGSQNSLCGGGRYDNLMDVLVKRSCPGIGFAAGIERAIMVMENEGISFPTVINLNLMVLPLGDKSLETAFQIVREIRKEGFMSVDLNLSNKTLKEQLKTANKSGALYSIIIGEREIEEGEVIVRDMISGKQDKVKISDLLNWFRKIFS